MGAEHRCGAHDAKMPDACIKVYFYFICLMRVQSYYIIWNKHAVIVFLRLILTLLKLLIATSTEMLITTSTEMLIVM